MPTFSPYPTWHYHYGHRRPSLVTDFNKYSPRGLSSLHADSIFTVTRLGGKDAAYALEYKLKMEDYRREMARRGFEEEEEYDDGNENNGPPVEWRNLPIDLSTNVMIMDAENGKGEVEVDFFAVFFVLFLGWFIWREVVGLLLLLAVGFGLYWSFSNIVSKPLMAAWRWVRMRLSGTKASEEPKQLPETRWGCSCSDCWGKEFSTRPWSSLSDIAEEEWTDEEEEEEEDDDDEVEEVEKQRPVKQKRQRQQQEPQSTRPKPVFSPCPPDPDPPSWSQAVYRAVKSTAATTPLTSWFMGGGALVIADQIFRGLNMSSYFWGEQQERLEPPLVYFLAERGPEIRGVA